VGAHHTRPCGARIGSQRVDKNSPSRWRFRPPNLLAFRFRVRPPGSTSIYSRSVLGARTTIDLPPRLRKGYGHANDAICANSDVRRPSWLFRQHALKEVRKVGPAHTSSRTHFAEPVAFSSTAPFWLSALAYDRRTQFPPTCAAGSAQPEIYLCRPASFKTPGTRGTRSLRETAATAEPGGSEASLFLFGLDITHVIVRWKLSAGAGSGSASTGGGYEEPGSPSRVPVRA
jgi:hypothetical protein